MAERHHLHELPKQRDLLPRIVFQVQRRIWTKRQHLHYCGKWLCEVQPWKLITKIGIEREKQRNEPKGKNDDKPKNETIVPVAYGALCVQQQRRRKRAE
jgi:hypothetical protein